MTTLGTQPSSLQIWWKTIRPATLWAGVAPVFVGSGLAFVDGSFQWLPATMAVVGSILIQIGCNLVNDYSDFETGADDEARLGPARAAQKGWLTVQELKRGAQVALAVAFIIGIYLSYVGGLPIFILGLLSILCAVAYTAGPFPLAYVGLGDVFVMVFFGFGAVGGSYFVQAMRLPAHIWPWCWAVGALATAILVVNNLRDRVGDAKVGKKTVVVRFGPTFARIQYTILVLSAFAVPLYAFWQFEPKSTGNAALILMPLIIAPLGFITIRQIWHLDGAALNPLLGKTARLELFFCVFATVGFLCV